MRTIKGQHPPPPLRSAVKPRGFVLEAITCSSHAVWEGAEARSKRRVLPPQESPGGRQPPAASQVPRGILRGRGGGGEPQWWLLCRGLWDRTRQEASTQA